ncbi:PAS domain-containing protein [Paenibacillus rhizovicinus]|uniref:histidine kinase n=1 Tax=Paenibacillus rhizovicinus TaxID=2704463 RepID=A0A6C0P6J7_9BACL|nr:ATP-binding protein [Paenibacillus rhizovicinus]QHW33981.1 PAS domain-containing protein [Paenibacillus rhizovicinus]
MGHFLLASAAFLQIFCSSLICLHLVKRMFTEGYAKLFWLVSAAFVFGVGIWSMHFVAMLAYPFDVNAIYRFGTVFLSMFIVIFMSFFSLSLFLYAVSRKRNKLLIAAGAVQTAGICAMHYVGMHAVKMNEDMHFGQPFSVPSILLFMPVFIGVFHEKRIFKAGIWLKMLSALALSIAISFLHYGNMPVIHPQHIHGPQNSPVQNMNNLILAITVVFVVAIILVYSVVILMIDSRLKKSEERLRQLNMMYSLTLNSVDEGILRLDEQKNVVFWNSAAAKITGFQSAEVVGKPPYFLASVNGEPQCPVRNIYDTGTEKSAEDMIYHKNGETLPVEFHITPMFNVRTVVGAVINFTDISERKKNESFIRASEKLSLAGQLAAGIAHEIRNPLTSVKGFVQLLQRGIQKPEYMPIMMSEINRMELIISELLMLAKPQNAHRKPMDMCELLEHVISLIESQAILNDVQIQIEYEEAPLFIQCDANQIKQVFINIIKNAIEASQGGTIQVRIERAGDAIVASVTDNGCGIPQDMLDQIGQPFFTTKEKGTGLGLTISNKIIASHEGTTAISSVTGIGTTFKISLPHASQRSHPIERHEIEANELISHGAL